ESWIAELSGDLEDACAILEQLGKERGLEGDVDRALALARVYEQLGDPDHLAKAINVCEYLARTLQTFESVATLGRLAALHRALAHEDEAANYERLFLAPSQRRMPRLPRAAATAIAATVYVPLDRLAAIRFTEPAMPEAPPRQRALASALLGDHSAAAEQLRGSNELIDRKYLAD